MRKDNILQIAYNNLTEPHLNGDSFAAAQAAVEE